jgi:hypothetical protein
MAGARVPSVEEARFVETQQPITLAVVVAAFAGGTVGLVAMAPLVAGIPLALGIFDTAPLASLAALFGADALVGIAVFAAGGVLVLPLFFVVTATFLPPDQPRWARGVTMASLFWVTFLFLFWPGDGALTAVVFLVVTLLGHWVYGLALGVVTHSLTGIPEHDV